MERIVAQIVEIVKRKYAKELVDKDDLKKAFKKVSDELTANSLKKYLEEYDQELRLDEKRNKNYVVLKEMLVIYFQQD